MLYGEKVNSQDGIVRPALGTTMADGKKGGKEMGLFSKKKESAPEIKQIRTFIVTPDS